MPNTTFPASATALPSASSSISTTPADCISAADPLASFLVRRRKHQRSASTIGRPDGPDVRIVLFRRDTGENGLERITAVFPCEPAMDGQMLGFTREEGAMTCSRLWFDLSHPARPEEYADLVFFLRAKGDRIDIRHRITPAMDATRARNHEMETLAAILADQEEQNSRAFRLRSSVAACRSAASIVASVTGTPLEAVGPEAGEVSKPSPARWAAMYLAVRVLGVDFAEVAEVYGRSVGGVERAIRRVEDARAANGVLSAMLKRMERLAMKEVRAAA